MFRYLTVALLAPTASFAACPDTTVLACTTNRGTAALEVCLAGSTVSYRYGPPAGPAEMVLTAALGPGIYRPSTDVGARKYQGLRIANASHAYESWFAFDSLTDTPPEAGVTVLQGEAITETVQCDPGSITANFAVLGQATEAAGFCWDPARSVWVPGACG